jgi:hypothetical protein
MNKYIFSAIKTKYDNATTLKAAMVGGMYLIEYPQQSEEIDHYPYCVIVPVSSVAEYTFTEKADNNLIQFSIWDNSDSISTISDVKELFVAAFDFAVLTVTGYNHICMMREYTEIFREDEYWHCVIMYRLEIQKAR